MSTQFDSQKLFLAMRELGYTTRDQTQELIDLFEGHLAAAKYVVTDLGTVTSVSSLGIGQVDGFRLVVSPLLAAPAPVAPNVKACALSAIERAAEMLGAVAHGKTMPKDVIQSTVTRLEFAARALKGEATLTAAAAKAAPAPVAPRAPTQAEHDAAIRQIQDAFDDDDDAPAPVALQGELVAYSDAIRAIDLAHWLGGTLAERIRLLCDERELAIEGRHPAQIARAAALRAYDAAPAPVAPPSAMREAAQKALETLEALQGGCTDSGDGTVEAITVWCPEVIEELRATLAAPAPVAQGEPVAWVNQSSLNIAAVGRVRGGPYDCHTWSECRTDYHAVPLYAAPAPVAPVKPINVSAVAEVARVKGELRLNWLVEGGIEDLPPGAVLVVADAPITDDEGGGEVYTAAPAPVAPPAFTPADPMGVFVFHKGFKIAHDRRDADSGGCDYD